MTGDGGGRSSQLQRARTGDTKLSRDRVSRVSQSNPLSHRASGAGIALFSAPERVVRAPVVQDVVLESGVHGLAQVNSRIAPRSRVSFCVNSSHFRAAQNAEPSGSAVSGIQAIRETGNSSAPERSEARLLQRSKVLHNYVTCSDVLFNAYLGVSP
ncbi:hypothetical protein PCL_09083 [Purpureocillium lilacinum]|uniref:Uncharacterized protein n=1 Tax=Purpureocillium lilacinum TaxID=33203 RepID=A0A2U3EH09_PURLI|nr:hypothetical protein Purlil1_10664 [Purpureocillium lilacinum]PWI73807.1 hypothetical protein PCL_09083 [Purpureocillium lilacinum]